MHKILFCIILLFCSQVWSADLNTTLYSDNSAPTSNKGYAMNHTTIKLVKDYYEAFNEQNMPRFFSFMTEDVLHDINQGHREVGKDAFIHFMERMNRSYHENISHLEIMTNADGTHAAAEFVVSGTYLATDQGLPPATGQKYRLPGGAFFDIRDGKIARVTNYYNLQDWLKQVQ